MIDFNKDSLTLIQLLTLYPTHKKLDKDYYSHLSSRVKAFCQWAASFEKINLTPADVTPQLQQAWVNELMARKKAPLTVRGYIRNLRTIMGFDEQLKSGKVILPKVELPTPEGFTTEEIKLLIKAAKSLKGRMKNGVRRRDFWLAALYTAFSIGVRLGDLFRLETSQIPDDGRMDWVQHKTGILVPVRFSKKALKAIRKHGKSKAVPWPYSRPWFEHCFEQLRNQAGIQKGTWKWLRRSGGSYADQDGRGHEFLGNSRAVFEKHYRVPKIVGDEPPKQVKL